LNRQVRANDENSRDPAVWAGDPTPQGRRPPRSEHHLRLWDLNTRRVSRVLAEHTRSVNSVAFSPDGSLLATAGNDGMLGLWKVDTGQRRASLDGQALSRRTVAFSPDGRILALTTWDDDDVRLWNASEKGNKGGLQMAGCRPQSEDRR
jgi:WD40 repeat protein